MGGRSDLRSDVWQLGVILHELFFGCRPQFTRTRRRDDDDLAAAAGGDAGRGGAGAPVPRLPGRQSGRASGDGGRGRRAPGGGRGGAAALGCWSGSGCAREARLRGGTACWRWRPSSSCGLRRDRARAAGRRAPAALPGGERQAGRRLGPGHQARGCGQAFERTGSSYAAETFSSVDRLLERLPRALARDVHRGLRGDQRARRAVGRGPRPAHGVPRRAAGRREGADRDLRPRRRRRRRQRRRRGRRARNAGALRRSRAFCATCLPLPEGAPVARQEVARLRSGIAEVKALRRRGRRTPAAASLQDARVVAEARRVHYAAGAGGGPPAAGRARGGHRGERAAPTPTFKEAALAGRGLARRRDSRPRRSTFLVCDLRRRSERFEEAADWARAGRCHPRRGSAATTRLAQPGWSTHVAAHPAKPKGATRKRWTTTNARSTLKQQSRAGLATLRGSLNNRSRHPHADGPVSRRRCGYFDQAIARARGASLGREHPLVATFISNKGETSRQARPARGRARRLPVEALARSRSAAYGPESTNVAYPLTGLGESFLGRAPGGRRPMPPLERAWPDSPGAAKRNAALVAETDFALGARGVGIGRRSAARAAAWPTGAEKAYAAHPRRSRPKAAAMARLARRGIPAGLSAGRLALCRGGDDLAAAGAADDAPVLEHHLAAADGRRGPGGQLASGVDGVARAREQLLVADDPPARVSPRSPDRRRSRRRSSPCAGRGRTGARRWWR